MMRVVPVVVLGGFLAALAQVRVPQTAPPAAVKPPGGFPPAGARPPDAMTGPFEGHWLVQGGTWFAYLVAGAAVVTVVGFGLSWFVQNRGTTDLRKLAETDPWLRAQLADPNFVPPEEQPPIRLVSPQQGGTGPALPPRPAANGEGIVPAGEQPLR